jgi:hypothetical protein
MLDEYALVPDIFDPSAYSHPSYIEMCLPHLKEALLQEAVVRDLCDGSWSTFCFDKAASLHRLCKEIVRKLKQNNRLRRFPPQNGSAPASAMDWCREGLAGHQVVPLTGIIAAHGTKQACAAPEVACIEKLTGTFWWQRRSPSLTVDRKTTNYLVALERVLQQANSLMFIDPNLDPTSWSYREFDQLFAPLARRAVKPQIEIHRSFCKGDGPARTFPTEAQWKTAFSVLGTVLAKHGLAAEVFFWDDFHDRYLIADVIGFSVGAGFDISAKPDDLSTWGRLGRDDKDKRQRDFDPAARANSLKWRFVIGGTT